jgi:hypothetical protein
LDSVISKKKKYHLVGARAELLPQPEGVKDNSIEELKSLKEKYIKENQTEVLTACEFNEFGSWELWTDIKEFQLYDYQTTWGIYPRKRYTVQVVNSVNNPVIDCNVELLDHKGKKLWVCRTDNTGKAELWDKLFENDTVTFKRHIKITYKNHSQIINDIKPVPNGVNFVKLDVDCKIPKKADVLFVVDATGSMSDEINFLQKEVLKILNTTSETFQDIELRSGSIFYRDYGEEYVTRVSVLTDDTMTTFDFIMAQRASLGGDFPEAVDDALKDAFEKISWSQDARARILFLILDAPPHNKSKNLKKIHKYIRLAAAQGVKIIPVTASGINKSTEYLMRSFALATNGTYVFLTDHSGVGNKHTRPTTDAYDVEKLNELIYRLLLQNLTVSSCNSNEILIDQTDTVFVTNIVEKNYMDLIVTSNKNTIDTSTVATNADTLIDYIVLNSDTFKITIDTTSVTQIKEEPITKSIKIYPKTTSGKLNIEVTGAIKEICIADMSGKLLNRKSTNDVGKLTIDISNYPNGIYFIQFKDGERCHKGAVILRHL